MILPVVTRELRVRARLPSTAYTRMGAAGLLALVLIPTVWSFTRLSAPANMGQILFQLVTWMLLVFALFEGVRVSAGVISDERREGTLGLLFLTDLAPVDILLGKLASTGLVTFLALLAAVPVLSIALLWGGVTGGEVFRGAVVLLNALCFALVGGLWASARARQAVTAMLVALGVVMAWVIVPMVVELVVQGLASGSIIPVNQGQASIGLLSPGLALGFSGEATYRAAPVRFWLGQLGQLVASAGLLAAAGSELRRTWRRETEPASPGPRSTSGGEGSVTPAIPSPRGGASNGLAGPAEFDAGVGRRLRLTRWRWVLLGLAAVPMLAQWVFLVGMRGGLAATGTSMSLLMLIQIPVALAALSVVLLLAHLAVRALSDARQSGELELLLTTPFGDGELVALLWAHFRPIVAALTLLAAVQAVALTGFEALLRWLWPPAATAPQEIMWLEVMLRGGSIPLAWFSNSALVWVGFWLGLRLRRAASAVGWTGGLVGILTPVLIQLVAMPVMIMTGGSGMMPIVVFQVGQMVVLAWAYFQWARWARRQLAKSFRTAAAGAGSA